MSDLISVQPGKTEAIPDLEVEPSFRLARQIVLTGRFDVLAGSSNFILARTDGQIKNNLGGDVTFVEAEIPPYWTFTTARYGVPGRQAVGRVAFTVLENDTKAGVGAFYEVGACRYSSVLGVEKVMKITHLRQSTSLIPVNSTAKSITSVVGPTFPLVNGTIYGLCVELSEVTAAKSKLVITASLILGYE